MRRPVFGLTMGLWKESERYLQNYWSTWKDVWHHGISPAATADGHWYIHGRSDDTLKIAGKRTGPAEIESLLMGSGRLAEAAAIGVPDRIKGSALVLVCSLKPGVGRQRGAESGTFAGRRAWPRRRVPAEGRVLRLRPAEDAQLEKIMRRVIRAAYLGEDAGDLSSLVNPEAVAELRARTAI